MVVVPSDRVNGEHREEKRRKEPREGAPLLAKSSTIAAFGFGGEKGY